MLIARSTLCQLPMTVAIARTIVSIERPLHSQVSARKPSVPSDSVDSFCSNVSIWVATAALRSRSSLRLSSSTFFSSMRARRAGDGPAPPETEDPRRWEENGRGGMDIVMTREVVGAAIAVTPGCCLVDGGRDFVVGALFQWPCRGAPRTGGPMSRANTCPALLRPLWHVKCEM